MRLVVEPGETVALLGPNGAGKSTALRVLAGLLRPSFAQVALAGRALDDTAGRLHVPPERRPVGMVFQDHRLFPHLTAAENIAFGLRTRGVRKRAARDVAEQWLTRVGLPDRGGSKPGQLSGGQAQRIALARALAPGPDLLLLDEPLAALDAATRIEVRAELRRHLGEFAGAAVLVTHDPLDAMVLANRVVVLEHGRVVQSGTVAEVAQRPRTAYVARLVGLNLYQGAAVGQSVKLDSGTELSVASSADGPVFVAFSPTSVAVFRTRPDGTPRNVFPATIADLELHGGVVRLRLTGALPASADVTAGAVAELGLAPGQEVWMAVKANETQVYPA
ncbi:MAG: sulfate/molybdate ABC transporter ATP-binding protein [Sporichthyaceae bacterium]